MKGQFGFFRLRPRVAKKTSYQNQHFLTSLTSSGKIQND